MRCREEGLALVTVLLLLAVLLVVALTYSDKLCRASRDTVQAGAGEQALQAAVAGIEWARLQLAATYRSSSGWASYLARGADGERYPETPAFTTVVGRITVDIFVRDNPDGDDDPHRDNDLRLFVLARARPATGPGVLVESLCGFEADTGGYLQAAQNRRRSSDATTDGLAEPWAAPLVNFSLTD
jgi:hypothetical protein